TPLTMRRTTTLLLCEASSWGAEENSARSLINLKLRPSPRRYLGASKLTFDPENNERQVERLGARQFTSLPRAGGRRFRPMPFPYSLARSKRRKVFGPAVKAASQM